MQNTDQHLGRALAGLGWLVIALLTLTSSASGGSGGDSPWCIACGPGWGADALANVLLFVPLGLGLALARARPRSALVAVAMTTLAVELLQFSVVTGRDASLSDLLTNFIGGALGYSLGRARARLLRPRPARAAALAILWSALWLAGTAATAWALTPSLPQSLWWAHWITPSDLAPGSPIREPRVLHASLGDVPIVFGPVRDWPELRDLAMRGAGMSVWAVVPSVRDTTTGKIALVDDADTEKELFAFRRRGDDITFAMGTRASMLGLHGPILAIPEVLSPPGPDSLRITGGISDGHLRLQVQRRTGSVDGALALSPNLGWSFFLPQRFMLGALLHPFTALWITCLVLPIGYWASRALRSEHGTTKAVALLAAILPALAFVAIPAWFHLPMVHWFEWLAWLVGVTLGALLARSTGTAITASRPLACAA